MKGVGSVPRPFSRAFAAPVNPSRAGGLTPHPLSHRGTVSQHPIAAELAQVRWEDAGLLIPLAGWRGSRRPRSKILHVGRPAAWASGGPSSFRARASQGNAGRDLASLGSRCSPVPRTGCAFAMVRTAGFEPARPLGAEDFKSPASTGSATSAFGRGLPRSPVPRAGWARQS